MKTTSHRIASLSLLACLTALAGCPGPEPEPDPDAGPADAGPADVGVDAAPDVAPDVTDDADAGAPDAEADADMGGPDVTTWTVLVYLAADNNLETSGINDIKEMMTVPDADHLEIIVQTDRAEDYYELGVGDIENWRESKRLRITNGDVEELASLGELNTGDPATLQDFMEWGFTTYPSDRHVLVLWNHGNAWRGYGNDDSSDHDMLTNDELDQAMGAALTTLGFGKLDLLGYDACLMAEDSVLRFSQKHADYMLASEEFEPNHGWDYASLELLVSEPEVDIPAFGEHVAREFKKQARDERRHMAITLSLLDLSKAQAALDAIDDFADTLAAAIPGAGTQIAEALAETQEYGRSADETKSYHSIDLVDFAERLAPLGGDVVTQGEAMKAAIEEMVLFELNGTRTRDSNGLAAYFPRLTVHYDAGFDQIAGVEAWRDMVRTYHGLVDQGADTPQLNKAGGVASTGTCGNGVCEATQGEDPVECAVDCARTGPTYDLPACADLTVDPAAPSAAPRTFPVCFGDYSVQCTWGQFGAWEREVTFCGGDTECGAPIGVPADASWPANYGACRPKVQTQGASCTARGELGLARQLDMNTMASVARSYLNVGFFPTGAQAPLIVGRVPARVDDATGEVTTEWDQRLLSVEQGGFTAVLFAESTRDDEEPALVLHEIPVEYTEPAACACDLPGDPGFADTDGDKVADCLDGDDDGDGVADAADNCPFVENQAQTDTDGDGTGDACETNTGAPIISCQPDPNALFGERQTAYLHVVTNEVKGEVESWTLYVRTPGGVAGATPLPGARVWPMALTTNAAGEREWTAPRPLPFNLLRPLAFTYNDLRGQLVVDERGVPQLAADGGAQTLARQLGLDQFFMELVVENLAGDADRSGFIGKAEDAAAQGCVPQPPALCPGGQIADCDGRCVSRDLLGDGVCHEGSAGVANFACKGRAFDQNDCPAPTCPAGLEPDCDGRCFPSVMMRRGDGTCHDGTNRALPRLSCEAFGYDGGDCPCGDQCSGRGTCQGGTTCACDGGFTGAYCQTPPMCGDATCGGGENCRNCPGDCGACPSACGDGVCQVNAGEDCANCAADCGACACGDGRCADTEDCTSCEADCGECPQCGDTVCQPFLATSNFPAAQGESCFDCPGDCGACQNDCCTPSEDSGLWPLGGGCSDATVAQCVCDLDPTCCEAGWPARCRDLAAASCGLTCCTPDCSGKDCGPDGCGGTCGSCSGDTVCSPTSTCDLPPRQDCCDPYAATGCAQDNVCESCVCALDPTCCSGAWDEGCSALASRQCNTECSCGCIPDCDGRACGDDGCGGTCGSCGANETCNPTTGACASAACPMNTDECDGDMTVACETDLLTSPVHCGACGRGCPGDVDAPAGCAGGACTLACAPGFLDCNGDLGQGGDGCETQAAACPRIEWALTWGDANNDWPIGGGTHMDVTTDPSGNIYAAPTTGPDLTFDGTPYDLGRQGSLVFSTDGTGAIRWSTVVASDSASGDAVITNIEHDPTTGDVFITASGFGGNLEIGGVNEGAMATACASIFARLDAATGATVWSTIVTSGCTRVEALAFGPAGELYVGGSFSGASVTIGADTYSTTGGGEDTYIARLDPANGAILSTFAIGAASTSNERVDGIAVLPGGDLLLVGEAVNGEISIGPNTFTNAGGSDIFFARYTAAGAHVWSDVVGTSPNEGFTDVVLSPGGEVYVSGYYTSTITIGPFTLDGSGMLLGRLDPSNGTFDWLTGHDGGASLSSNADNRIVVDANEVIHVGFTSTSSPTTTFAGLPLPNVGAPRIASVDGATGAGQRLETFGPTSSNFAIRAVALLPGGEKVAIGWFDGTRNLDGANMTSVGMIDHFLWRMTY